MNAFFQFVGRYTKLEDALTLIAALEQKQADAQPETGLEDDGNDLNTLKQTVTELGQDYTLLNSLLQKVLEENTRRDLEDLKQSITATDYRSAYDLTTFYDKKWFSLLFFTLDGKIELADYLLGLVRQYKVTNTGTFDAILAENPDMLEYISSPHA